MKRNVTANWQDLADLVTRSARVVSIPELITRLRDHDAHSYEDAADALAAQAQEIERLKATWREALMLFETELKRADARVKKLEDQLAAAASLIHS